MTKMEHSYYRDRISRYYDNELPSEEREAVRQHLSQCQECRSLLARLGKLDQFAHEHSQLANSDYWELSAQKIERRLGFASETKVVDIRPSRWWARTGKLAAVAASIAVLGFIALYEKDISREASRQSPQPTEAPHVRQAKDTAKQLESAHFDKTNHANERAEATQTPKGHLLTDQEKTAQQISKKAEVAARAGIKPAAQEYKAEVAMLPPGKAENPPAHEEQVVGVEPTRQEDKALKAPSGQAVMIPSPEQASSLSKSVPFVADKGARETTSVSHDTIRPAESRLAENTSAPGKVGMKATAPEDETTGLVAGSPALPDEWLPDTSIERWRYRRDSLLTLQANLKSPHLDLSTAKSRRDKTAPSDVGEVETRLLYCYFQIARLSQNEGEQQEAVRYLTDYSHQKKSRWRNLALDYLERLGNKDK